MRRLLRALLDRILVGRVDNWLDQQPEVQQVVSFDGMRCGCMTKVVAHWVDGVFYVDSTEVLECAQHKSRSILP